jgi:cytidylate kinase
METACLYMSMCLFLGLKDKNRDVSPLLIPQGAKVIDSTNLSIDEVVNKIMDLI